MLDEAIRATTRSSRSRRNDDFTFWASYGKSNLGVVKNQKIRLSKFRERLANALMDNSISFAGYQKLSQDDKAERKKMAGFLMAATFKDGKRKSANQENRTVLTYDMDFITVEQLETLRSGMAPICAYHWFMHTTRSHCPEKPRVRIFVFLSRPVGPDEYYALTRLVACLLADTPAEGIEIPDPVSFKYNQLMYLPSISREQEYWADENRGEILNVDEFLAQYPNWQDVSTIPQQAKAGAGRLTDPGATMENPRLKRGWIGAFCRAYPIEDCIETFLSDIYVPGTGETDVRYSYAPGTSRNGAIVYDDGLFLTSHHGSDPADGTHNSWDLVRIHLFGHKDAKVREDAGPTSRPSHAAMVEMVSQDERTLQEFGGPDFDDEDDDDAGYDADEEDDAPEFDDDEEDDPDLADLIGTSKKASKEKPEKPKSDKKWKAQLRRKASGELLPVLHNAALICEHDPRIGPAIAYNEFTHDPVAVKQIKAKGISSSAQPVPASHGYRQWQSHDDTAIQLIFSAPANARGWEFDPPQNVVQKAVVHAGLKQAFHPVRDRIKGFHEQWIAAGRPTGLIDTLPQTYCGRPDDAFHRESSRMLFVALVSRVFEPGCKFDCVAILRGPQGGRKSEVWKVLGLDDYYGELPKDFDNTGRMIEAMRGKLVLEMGEMAGLRRDTAESAKEFIVRRSDRFRLAYAQREEDYKRQCILTGTSNLDEILHDPTGNRRFWIWEDEHKEGDPIDIDRLRASVPMLFGEAYQAYLDMREEQPNGELWLDLRSAEARAGRDKLADQYRGRTAVEIIAETIQEWLETPISAREIDVPGVDKFDSDGDDEWYLRNIVTAKEAFEALRSSPALSNYRNADSRTFGKAMAYLKDWEALGFVHREGKRDRFYRRKGSSDERYLPIKDVTARREALEYDDLI